MAKYVRTRAWPRIFLATVSAATVASAIYALAAPFHDPN